MPTTTFLYMVAGQLIEDVTGETWEKFVAEHVLKPAGMLHSTTDNDGHFSSPDRAQPHARMNGGLRGVGDQAVLNERDNLGSNASPAGGLAVSANDMARWLMIQLDGGALPDNGGRLFSEAAHDQMWKPVVLQPVGPRARRDGTDAAHVQHLRARLGCPGLSRRQDRLARRGGFRFPDRGGAHSGQTRGILHRDQQRGWRNHHRIDV